MLDPSGRHTWWHCTERIAGIWSHVFPYVHRHHPVVRIDMLMAKSRHNHYYSMCDRRNSGSGYLHGGKNRQFI